MIQEYYIISGKSRSGPYDMVTVVRKIRNGTLTAHTQLQMHESEEPKPAGQWAELSEFFTESKDDRAGSTERGAAKGHSLSAALQNGWRFLQRNQYSTVSSGLLVLLVILFVAMVNVLLPLSLHVFAYMTFFIAGHLLLSFYMLSVLRMARGQPVDTTYMQSKIAPAIKSLAMASAFISIPAITGLSLLTSSLPSAVLLLGLIIFAVPGLFFMALYAFTPLLILDKGYDFWEGMETSRKVVLKSGLENVGLIYALFVINFLAALCMLLPLVITLPITMGALADIYDEMFT